MQTYVQFSKQASSNFFLPPPSHNYLPSLLQCMRRAALEAFFGTVNEGPAKIAYLGSGCSEATEPVAEISDFFNLIHVSTQAVLEGLH